MQTRDRGSRFRQTSGRGGRGVEWVGGRLTPPFFITDRAEPYRPAVVMWMELPDGLVVGYDMVAPESVPDALGRTLRAALKKPLVGPPRRPARIRVGDASLAREVREAVGPRIPIKVAPTPELDEILETMRGSMPEGAEEASYLEGGRVSPATVARLFDAAGILYNVKPWKVADDGQVLRMDIPALGIEGACVSIIGALGQSLGLLIFPSFQGCEAFRSAAEGGRLHEGPLDLGTDWLALNFEKASDLPPGMRREVAKHGWPVASADAYPVVDRRERDGAARPLVERDVEIAAAAASALGAFFARNQKIFAADKFEPVCESFSDENDLEVRFTAPYEAFPEFELAEPDSAPEPASRFEPKVGRNDPCPCGSGRKYKKCHLPLDEAEHSAGRQKDRLHELDARVVAKLSRFAEERFGDAWWEFENDFQDPREALQLAVPWSVYGFQVDGRTAAEAYLESRGKRCSAVERVWMEAQRAAWLSVWEVAEVEPGKKVTLRDLLSGEVRKVWEASGSESLVLRDAVLARVVDHEGVSVLCGAHPRPLPPAEAAEVVRLARGRLRRKRAVPVERLRDGTFGRYLIRRWEKVVEHIAERASIPRVLQNTDGDPLLLTTDHFRIEPGARREIETRLSAIPGVEPRETDEELPAYVFLRPGSPAGAAEGTTVLGRATLSGDTLRLETNSVNRADALRSRVEKACGGLIRHRIREHEDPLSSRADLGESEEEPVRAPGFERAVLEYKKRHYANWLDHPLPALGGQTPRDAVRTTKGRAAVDVLLKEMENHEQRGFPAEERFDFSGLRTELGLDRV